MPHTFIITVILIIFSFLASNVFGQTTEQKTQDLIAALAKTKYKKKEKQGISFELYVNVKNEAVVKNNVRDYAGVYASSDDSSASAYSLDLRVTPEGRVEGNGYDSDLNSDRESFTLRNARIEGALLTATKVYANGKTRDFEALFVNRTVTQGKNPNEINTREIKYGLGFVSYDRDNKLNITNTIFLEFKP